MIRRKSKLCKLFSSSLSDFSYISFISSYRPALEVCPTCGSSGNCIKHGYYYRSIIHSSDDRLQADNRTKILRVKCKGCLHTHAVLPDFIIPYRTHSLLFLVKVLLSFYNKSMSINAICRNFYISKQLFCRWRSIYLSHRFNFLGSLKAKEEDVDKILEDLYSSQTQPFLRDFFLLSGVSFLQLHTNPTANLGQRPIWNNSDFTDPHKSCSDAFSLPAL